MNKYEAMEIIEKAKTHYKKDLEILNNNLILNAILSVIIADYKSTANNILQYNNDIGIVNYEQGKIFVYNEILNILKTAGIEAGQNFFKEA